MKKIILFTVMLLAAASCSDDDSAENKTAQEPLVRKITVEKALEPNQAFDFIYDAQNRLVEILQNGASAYKYEYNEQNYISEMFFRDEAYAVFHYNVNNIVSGYEFGDGGNINLVTYDAATNTYRFPPNRFTLEENGDVSANFNQKIIFGDHKGPFTNVDGINIQLMHHFVGMLTFVCNKKAIEEILDLNNNKVYELETLYNEAGYPIQIEVNNLTGNDDRTITLEY